MTKKASGARIGRYSNRVEELTAVRKAAMKKVAFWIALVIIDCIIGIIVFYQDESIRYEPAYWVALIGIMIVCYIGEYRNWGKFTLINEQYHDAVDRYEKLVGKAMPEQGASDAK